MRVVDCFASIRAVRGRLIEPLESTQNSYQAPPKRTIAVAAGSNVSII
jgi:hypothetical protein